MIIWQKWSWKWYPINATRPLYYGLESLIDKDACIYDRNHYSQPSVRVTLDYVQIILSTKWSSMGLLPDTKNCELRMRGECRERFSRHRLQRKPLVSDPSMHHGTCATHVPCCMSGSLTCGGGENIPGDASACATRNFAYVARGPRIQINWTSYYVL